MSRLRITPWENAQRTVDDLYADMERRISAAPCGNCPVELTSAFLKLCLAQSCGKCVPCRIGLDRLADLLDRLLTELGVDESMLDQIADLTFHMDGGYKALKRDEILAIFRESL